MGMVFEKAIQEASTMFLFDTRSQQQLQEMAEEAAPGTKDLFLIRLTQAAFIYYNAFDSQGWEIHKPIRQAQTLLNEVKKFRKDRVFYTLALRLEIDLLLHRSRLQYQEAPPKKRPQFLYTENDQRALSICDMLLKNFPETFEPYPNSWYTSLIPLFPSFREEVLEFYGDRVKENRVNVLQKILTQVKQELIHVAGMVRAKKFLSESKIDTSRSELVNNLLLGNIRELSSRLENKVPSLLHVATDVTLPKGLSMGQLDSAAKNVEGQIRQANTEKDLRKYTSSLLQLGILFFLRQNGEKTINALVNTLRASSQLEPELKEIRQFRHEEFSDIPFMIGTSFLKLALNVGGEEERKQLLHQGKAAFRRALVLQDGYHHAYQNLVLSMQLSHEPRSEEVVDLYLNHFNRDMNIIDGQLFKNLSLIAFQTHKEELNPETLQWLIISHFCHGGHETMGKNMLQELKTLYVLNAHDISTRYLTEYRTGLRQNIPEFIADLEDTTLHSALLFYLSHAFTSLSLTQGRRDSELVLNHENLDQSVELNADSLYFNEKNSSAIRLVETQTQILSFALKRSEKRWEKINSTLGSRFQFYEDFLRQQKSYQLIKDRLESLALGEMVPQIQISQNALSKIDVTLTQEQRERLQTRVKSG